MLSFRRSFFSTPKTLESQNLIEKIIQKYAVNPPSKVQSGDFVSIQPQHVMTHDNTAAVIQKFNSIKAKRFKNPKQPVFTLDHDIQNTSKKNLEKYDSIAKFAKTHSVDFYPAGRGIGHQVVIEEGYAFPYTLTVASDSHSNMYGGIGSLGTPIVRTDAAAIWATGRTWWQIPPVAKVILQGRLPKGTSGKDIIITLCGLFNKDQVLNHAIEFVGDDIKYLSIDDRLTISNMTTEWGALAGVFPVDKLTINWLKDRQRKINNPSHPRINSTRIKDLEENPIQPDRDAYYAKTLTLDLSTISPYISGPNSVKKATPLNQLDTIKIHKAYLVSCTNSRLSDIQAAASVVRGKKVAKGVEFYIAAASSLVQRDAENSGDWKALIDAGAIPLPAGCGPCIGLGTGLLKDNEVGISATNRNFKGRMGSPLAQAYLASPEVVAASAISGYITSPSPSPVKVSPKTSIIIHEKPKTAVVEKHESCIDAFNPILKGELVFCDADNLNTDGIYPGKYTYVDDISPSQMKEIVMENYDKSFAKNIQPNDILVSGYNFGSGSSREQAATAIVHAGIKLVLAGSFSETYKRNAMNNALLVLESPELVKLLREAAKGTNRLTWRTGKHVCVDLNKGELRFEDGGGCVTIPRVGKAAQELVVEGGLEKWVKNRLD